MKLRGLIAMAWFVVGLACKGDGAKPAPSPVAMDAARVPASALDAAPALDAASAFDAAPAPLARVRLNVKIERWSTPLHEPAPEIEAQLSEAGLAVLGADAPPGDAAATIELTYRETRGAAYRNESTGERITATNVALALAMTSADGARTATFLFKGRPKEQTGYLEHSTVQNLRNQSFYKHIGKVAAYVAGAIDAQPMLTLLVDEHVYPADRDVIRLYAQLGLRLDGPGKPYVLARTRKWKQCRALGSPCTDAAIAVIERNAWGWFGSGASAQILAALDVIAADPRPDAVAALNTLGHAMLTDGGLPETRVAIEAKLAPLRARFTKP